MSYTWDGEHIEPKADARTDTLGFKEIGGIGQLIYHLFRFKDYKLEYGKNNKACAFPICEKVREGRGERKTRGCHDTQSALWRFHYAPEQPSGILR